MCYTSLIYIKALCLLVHFSFSFKPTDGYIPVPVLPSWNLQILFIFIVLSQLMGILYTLYVADSI